MKIKEIIPDLAKMIILWSLLLYKTLPIMDIILLDSEKIARCAHVFSWKPKLARLIEKWFSVKGTAEYQKLHLF